MNIPKLNESGELIAFRTNRTLGDALESLIYNYTWKGSSLLSKLEWNEDLPSLEGLENPTSFPKAVTAIKVKTGPIADKVRKKFSKSFNYWGRELNYLPNFSKFIKDFLKSEEFLNLYKLVLTVGSTKLVSPIVKMGVLSRYIELYEKGLTKSTLRRIKEDISQNSILEQKLSQVTIPVLSSISLEAVDPLEVTILVKLSDVFSRNLVLIFDLDVEWTNIAFYSSSFLDEDYNSLSMDLPFKDNNPVNKDIALDLRLFDDSKEVNTSLESIKGSPSLEGLLSLVPEELRIKFLSFIIKKLLKIEMFDSLSDSEKETVAKFLGSISSRVLRTLVKS
jgi:hypothetical protein